MIRGAEFIHTTGGDRSTADKIADYCNMFGITRDQIISINYSANNKTERFCSSAILIYEED